MIKSKYAKYLISFCAIVTIVIPSIMDLNSTHMTNPLWAPHARFHWSIQWYAITILNGISLYLLWGKYADAGSRLAIVMAGVAPILFWGSFIPSLFMPGTSPWPDGIEPFAVLPPNVYIAVLITLLSGLGIWIDFHSRSLRKL
jgi:tryptophan-rich sensory protein